MPETYAANVGNIYIPQANENDYVTGSTSLRQTLVTLGDSCYSAGNTVPTAGIQDSAVTTAKINDGAVTSAKLASGVTVAVITNDSYLQWRNNANSADLNVMKVNTSDKLQIDTQITQLRMANDTYITGRNNADSAYINLVKVDTNDDIQFGAEIAALKLKQNTFLTGRNAADSGDINLIKVDASDDLSVGADLVPATDSTHDLGKSGAEWADLYVDNVKNGANTIQTIDSNGISLWGLQPAFLAIAAAQTNVTGDGTDYTVTWTGSEIADRNSDFSSPNFTAPVTGLYLITGTLRLDGVGAGHLANVFLRTTNRDHLIFNGDINAVDNGGTWAQSFSFICDMNATDTAHVRCVVSGGALAIDVSTDSRFAGFLLG